MRKIVISIINHFRISYAKMKLRNEIALLEMSVELCDDRYKHYADLFMDDWNSYLTIRRLNMKEKNIILTKIRKKQEELKEYDKETIFNTKSKV